ncbi:MAG: class I SAM-dependent methyltransferase [Chlorobium sp.]
MSLIKHDVQGQSGKDDWSEHWQAYAKSASENPAQKMRHDIILEKMNKLTEKPEIVIDFGSGQGDFLCKAVASHKAKKYVGFEMSSTGVSISRTKVPEAEFIQVNLFFPTADVSRFIGQGDIAVCSDVIEHVDEPEKFCQQLKSYLKPGAYLLLTVPGGPMSDFDRHIGHRMHYDKTSITQLLTDAGFDVQSVVLLGFPFFNLYRMMIILRGSRLISDVENKTEGFFLGLSAKLLMRIFHLLFRFNIAHSRYGWQVFAVARCPM